MRALVLLLTALLVAGCTGQGDPAPTETASTNLQPAVIVDPALPDGAGGVAPAGGAPQWLPGDAWLIETTEAATEETVESVLVVIGASPDAYTLATTSEQMAAYDAMFDVSYLGQIRASDLAGSQQGQPIKYFDFPLEDGKTWTTSWDEFQVALVAKQGARGFDITGTVDGEPFVDYSYVPELKWWGHLHFAEGYGFTVTRLVTGWTGETITATANVVFEASTAAPVLSPGTGAFPVAEGQSFLMVSISGGGAAWARSFHLLQPDGQPYMTTTGNAEVSGDSFGYFYTERVPATPGEWHISAPMVHEPEGHGSVLIHEIATTTLAFP